MNHTKYRPFPPIDYPQRTWPSRQITKAPIWCSVDLRDGNQSLETPMCLAQKLEFFQFLTETGFKEIEIGFPSASETEYEITRERFSNATSLWRSGSSRPISTSTGWRRIWPRTA